MSAFLEEFQWNWEFNNIVKAETMPQAIELMKKGEHLEAENERLKEWIEYYGFTHKVDKGQKAPLEKIGQ